MGRGDDSPPPRRRKSDRKSDRKSERSSADGELKSAGDGVAKGEARSRLRTSGRDKGIRESTSWRSDGSDWGLAPFEEGGATTPEAPSGSPHVERSPRPTEAAADSAQLEAELAALCVDAAQWLGGGEAGPPASPGHPPVRRGSSRALLVCPGPTAPDGFAAGRQWPPQNAADARGVGERSLPPPLWEASALSCPADFFDQVYSAWLWGPGEAGAECLRTTEYLAKWVRTTSVT
jgi:hypothetical protein